MSKIITIILFSLSAVINSCSEINLDRFYQNKSQLLKFSEHFKNQSSAGSLCCINQECLTSDEKELLSNSGFTCVRRDTTERTIAFIVASKDQTFAKHELLYYYGDSDARPTAYPKAGETLKKLDGNWYIRYYSFD